MHDWSYFGHHPSKETLEPFSPLFLPYFSPLIHFYEGFYIPPYDRNHQKIIHLHEFFVGKLHFSNSVFEVLTATFSCSGFRMIGNTDSTTGTDKTNDANG